MAKKITVMSLSEPEHTGWMTKQGGSVKNWKRRYFVMKGNQIYYFKDPKDNDVTGVITLTTDSFVRKEANKKTKKNLLTIGTPTRTYFMFPDSEVEQSEWIRHVQNRIDEINGKVKNSPVSTKDDRGLKSQSTNLGPVNQDVRVLLEQGKNEIPFLESSENNRVYEFWKIWSESIPNKKDIDLGRLVFEISISGDMEKLSWRAYGPQHIFIQKMVDFFFHVGAPEGEIDHLNDIGSTVNPTLIGSWIDMSGKGGMDGGWFFPVDIPLPTAIQSADPGESLRRLMNWAERNGIKSCTSIGRDMGAAPPRQTEFRIELAGEFSTTLPLALAAHREFGFPDVPAEAVEIIKSLNSFRVALSLVAISDDFVRIGMIFPDPPKATVESLCNLSGGNSEQLLRFERAIGSVNPTFVEFQCLKTSFGYGVYKEGFDVMFHYKVGEEQVDEKNK